jgi:methyl-accepting chemotaxis protein
LNDELTRSLETISKSEKMINSNMSEIGEQYRSQSEELKKMSAHFNNLSASMKEMNESYRLFGEKLEQIQVYFYDMIG